MADLLETLMRMISDLAAQRPKDAVLVKSGAAPIEVSTEFDGTAGFEQLAVGTYDFQLDPEQAERLHMHLVKPVQIVVPPIRSATSRTEQERENERTVFDIIRYLTQKTFGAQNAPAVMKPTRGFVRYYG